MQVSCNFALHNFSVEFATGSGPFPDKLYMARRNGPTGEIEMSEMKIVTRDGFDTIEAARADAKRFVEIGGKVIDGGRRENGFGWEGEIRVHDTLKSVAGTFHCGRCAGTGAFITGSLNGKPTGPGGICFRCEGKGRHTAADRKRNFWYDVQAFAREARRMMAA